MKTKIKEMRMAAGLTQQQLADAWGYPGRTIISIETGRYNPSLLLAYRLARLFGTTGGGAVLPAGKSGAGGG